MPSGEQFPVYVFSPEVTDDGPAQFIIGGDLEGNSTSVAEP